MIPGKLYIGKNGVIIKCISVNSVDDFNAIPILLPSTLDKDKRDAYLNADSYTNANNHWKEY